MALIGHDIAEPADIDDALTVRGDLRVRGEAEIEDILNGQSFGGAPGTRAFGGASISKRPTNEKTILSRRTVQPPD